MSERTCSVDGCGRPVLARTWCRMHYLRWYRNGSLELYRPTIEERFWSKVDKSGDCWLWTAGRTSLGYGQFSISRKPLLSHRFAYILLVGPIPDGLQLDHLCRVRHCVNPKHLEPVTGAENTRRGVGPSAANARKTSCVNGHAFTEENTYIYGGDRNCRTCRNEASRRYLERRRRVA